MEKIYIKNKIKHFLFNKKSAIICSIFLLLLSFAYWLNYRTDWYLVQTYGPSIYYPDQVKEAYYLGHINYNKLTKKIYIGNIDTEEFIHFFEKDWLKKINNGYVENVSLDEWNQWNQMDPASLHLFASQKSHIFNVGEPLYPKGTPLPVKITDENQSAYLDDFFRNNYFEMHWLEFILHWDSVVEKIRARRFFSKSPKEFEALKYQDAYIPFAKKMPKTRSASPGRKGRVNHKLINYPPPDPPDYDY